MTGTEIYKRTATYEAQAREIKIHAPHWKLLLAYDGVKSLSEVALTAEISFADALPLTQKFLDEDWIAEQPWSDGRIGTMGLSYAAHTQGALACLDPPGLKAIVLDCGGTHTTAVSVFSGHSLRSAACSAELGGQLVDESLPSNTLMKRWAESAPQAAR